MALLDNPLVLGVLVGLIVLLFFVYLMIRRTVMGFREGLNQGRN